MSKGYHMVDLDLGDGVKPFRFYPLRDLAIIKNTHLRNGTTRSSWRYPCPKCHDRFGGVVEKRADDTRLHCDQCKREWVSWPDGEHGTPGLVMIPHTVSNIAEDTRRRRRQV